MVNNYNFTISPRDVDFSRKSTIISLCDYILQSAGCDADTLGYGTRDLICKSQAWVLLRMSVEVYRYPCQYESINIDTWLESADKIYSSRSFSVQDKNGAVLAVASTYWSIIDYNTRKLQDITYNTPHQDLVDERKIGIRPTRIHNIISDDIFSHMVSYTDIDFNGHANTTKQIGWMLDTLPITLFETGRIKRLDINFMHESRYGSCVNIMCQKQDNKYIFSLSSNGISLCNTAVEFDF